MVDKQDLLKKMVDKALFGRENGRYYKKEQSKPLMISGSLCSFKDIDNCSSFEIPVRFIVVELNALGAAEAGEDLHDVILLLGGDFVFTMMGTVVWTHACAKV